jgi:hypothetical protein
MSVLHGVLDQTSRHPGEFDVFGLTDPPQQVNPVAAHAVNSCVELANSLKPPRNLHARGSYS